MSNLDPQFVAAGVLAALVCGLSVSLLMQRMARRARLDLLIAVREEEDGVRLALEALIVALDVRSTEPGEPHDDAATARAGFLADARALARELPALPVESVGKDPMELDFRLIEIVSLSQRASELAVRAGCSPMAERLADLRPSLRLRDFAAAG